MSKDKLRRNEKICECAHSNFLHEMGTMTRCLAYMSKLQTDYLCGCQESSERKLTTTHTEKEV